MSLFTRNPFSLSQLRLMGAAVASLLSACSGDTETLEKELASARAEARRLKDEVSALETKMNAGSAELEKEKAKLEEAMKPPVEGLDPKLMSDETFKLEQSLAFNAYKIRHMLSAIPDMGTIEEVRFKKVSRLNTLMTDSAEVKSKPFSSGFAYLIREKDVGSMVMEFNITANVQGQWDSPSAETVAMRYRETKQLLVSSQRQQQPATTSQPIAYTEPGTAVQGGIPTLSQRTSSVPAPVMPVQTTHTVSWDGPQAQPAASTQPQVIQSFTPPSPSTQPQAAPTTSAGPNIPAPVMPVQDTKIIRFK